MCECDNLTTHEISDRIGEHDSRCPEVKDLYEKSVRLRKAIKLDYDRPCFLQPDGSLDMRGVFTSQELASICIAIGAP